MYAELLGAGADPEFSPSSTLDGVTLSLGAKGGSPVNTGTVYGRIDPDITFIGGTVGSWGSTFPKYNYTKTYNLTLSNGTREGIEGIVAFETDATSFDLKLYNVGYTSSFVMLVDGKIVRASSQIVPSSDGSQRWLTVDLSGANLEPGFHKIEFNFAGGANFGGLVVNPGAEVRALPADGPRVVYLGDSFTEGTGSSTPVEDYTSIAGRLLGTSDLVQSGAGGTGWIKPNGPRPALVDRIQQDGVDANGDIYVIAMGVNDDKGPALHEAIVSTLTTLVDGQPNAKIFVVSNWNVQGPGSNGKEWLEDELEAIVALFPTITFLDASGATFTKSDTTHPDPAGHYSLGRWLGTQINYEMGADGRIDQDVAGDIVGPLYLKGFDAAETYTFTVLENGFASSRFEIIETGDAFPILKLIDGVAVSALTPISIAVHITGSLGTDYMTMVEFDVRSHKFATSSTNTMRADAAGSLLDGKSTTDYLFGAAGDDELRGGSGNDQLTGGGGTNLLIGGSGNDFYFISSPTDILIELADGGRDVVFPTFDGFVLPDNFEELNLREGGLTGGGNDSNNYIRGNSFDNKLYGWGGDDRLEGYDGADTLFGNDGNDILDGGKDVDRLVGGNGDDTYYVNDEADTVVEASAAGKDLVFSTANSYTLPVNVESLTLQGQAVTGIGNDVANGIRGNESNNTLSGLGGNDNIFGYGGNDTLLGGKGIDTLYGGNGDDTLDGGAGNDKLYGDTGFDTAIFTKTSASYALSFGGGSLRVRDTATGEIDLLFAVEQLSFSNGTFLVDYVALSVTPV